MDVQSGLFFVTNNESRAATLGIPSFVFTSHGPDFRDVARYRTMFAGVLHDPYLREKLLEISATYIPDGKNDNVVDTNQVIKKLTSLGVTSGLLVELGCGNGESAAELKNRSAMDVIGVDRHSIETITIIHSGEIVLQGYRTYKQILQGVFH